MVSTEKLGFDQEISSYKLLAVDDSVGGDAHSPVEKSIEQLLLWTYQTLGSEQLVKAKEQFYWKTGKVFPDDYFFQRRISYFIDHLLFERPVESVPDLIGKTPYSIFREKLEEYDLKPVEHSVFCVTKISENSLTVKDLINGSKHLVTARPSERLDGISKNDMFQGFLFSHEEQVFLSRGIIFHPYKAYRVIRKNIKKAINKEDFQASILLHKLARQQLRQCRHEHVDPRKFYSDNQI